jgi:hypothetical protein
MEETPFGVLVIVIGFCLYCLYAIPESPCDDDTYLLDRDLFTQEVRDRCEKPGQNNAPPVMINEKQETQ